MKILCFGDSNTYGYDPRSYFGGRYPAQYRWGDLLAENWAVGPLMRGKTGGKSPKEKQSSSIWNGCSPRRTH